MITNTYNERWVADLHTPLRANGLSYVYENALMLHRPHGWELQSHSQLQPTLGSWDPATGVNGKALAPLLVLRIKSLRKLGAELPPEQCLIRVHPDPLPKSLRNPVYEIDIECEQCGSWLLKGNLCATCVFLEIPMTELPDDPKCHPLSDEECAQMESENIDEGYRYGENLYQTPFDDAVEE